MKNKIIFIMVLLLSIISVVSTPYIIDGNSIYIEDNNVLINATPHTLNKDGLVYIDLLSKQFTGNINFLLGVDTESFKPTKLEYLNNQNKWILYNGSYETFDFNYDNKNKWFLIENISIEQNVNKKVRIYFNILSKTNSKYDIAFYPTSYGKTPQNIGQALNDNKLYLLDPFVKTNYVIDSFNRSNGVLNGNTANNGGTWTSSGATITSNQMTTLNYVSDLSIGSGNITIYTNFTFIEKVNGGDITIRFGNSGTDLFQIRQSSSTAYCLDGPWQPIGGVSSVNFYKWTIYNIDFISETFDCMIERYDTGALIGSRINNAFTASGGQINEISIASINTGTNAIFDEIYIEYNQEVLNEIPYYNITTPLNNSVTSDGLIVFNYSVFDDDDKFLNTSLYVNDMLFFTNDSISNGTIIINSYNFSLGSYSWYILINDGINITKSDVMFFESTYTETKSSVTNVDLTQTNNILEYFTLMILLFILIGISLYTEKGSLLIISSIYGLAIFFTTIDNVSELLSIITLCISLVLIFMGYKMLKK